MNARDSLLDTPDFVARLCRQDEACFGKLVKHYHARLQGFAGSICGGIFAEEVMQEAWMAIWRGLPGFEARSSLKTWLYTVVRNECRAKMRKEKRLVTVNIAEEGFEDGIDAWFAANFASDGHWRTQPPHWNMETPDELLQEEQLRDCLEKNVASLQALQSSIFRLRDMDQMPMEDICNILEVSHSNARVLLHRARIRLLQVINHYQETGEC